MPKTSIKDMVEGNELDLSMNELSDVPVHELAKATKATHLDLSCNSIKVLPNSFSTLTHLVKIDLSKNFLSELPHNFGNLTNLTYLDLYENKLTFLPLSICRLKNLKWLDLKNNPLDTKLQSIAGDCLDPKQCAECAKNVVLFYQTLESEMERQKQKRLKEEREREAEKLAKEQEQLAEQRRIKKAERERRKAEAKARQLESHRQEKQEEDEKLHQINNATKREEKKEKSSSKSASYLGTCFFITMMIPVLAVCSLVGLRIWNGHSVESWSNLMEVFEEVRAEFQDTMQIWYHAFAVPYYESLKATVENWLQSIKQLV